MSTVLDLERQRRGYGEKKPHSCFVRTLIVFNVFFLIAIVLSIAIIYRFGAIIKENKASNVCVTAGCVNAAADVLDLMDPTVGPCEDFYNFACGQFLNRTVLSDEKVSIDTFSISRDHMQSQLYQLIDAPIQPNESRSFKLVKRFYKACMNRTRIEEIALDEVKTMIASLGGWPVVVGDEWNGNSTWTWTKSMQQVEDLGFEYSYLFIVSVDTDMKNSTHRRIVFDEPSLGLSREFLLQGLGNDVVRAYFEYMVDMAEMFGADPAEAREELTEVLEFETNLANISMPMEQRRNSTELYNKLTLSEVQAKHPYMDWMELVNQMLPPNLTVNENETVIFNSLSYFEKFGALLESTSNRTIANYLSWRMVEYAAFYLNTDVRKRQLDYNAVSVGKKEFSARWKECISLTNTKLSAAVGALYIRQHFRPEVKLIAREMVDQIRREFKEMLRKNEWMDPETKLRAAEKVDAIITHIGYPDELYDDVKLDEYHHDIDVDETNYLKSVLSINKFYTNYQLNLLRKPANKTDWVSHSSPTFINAYYSFEENSIELPAGILQGIFFSPNRPKYMNFGGIGFIIGHELTHGFDDEGRQYDSKGDLFNWWKASTESRFLERAQCMINQYGNFTEPSTGLSINGINTQGENIADNGGIKFAYNAYKKWSTKYGLESRLPGLQQYTPEQMFWISAAQTWCSMDRTEYMRIRILNGIHAPDKYRVIGSLSNSEDFAKDFQCESGSPMNPKDKCMVW